MEKILSIQSEKDNDVVIRFDGDKLTNESFQFITNLPIILQDSGEVGDMKYDIFEFTINSLKTYEKDLIVND